MKLFLELADNGNADSQNNLGYMYAYGIGTDIDYSKAKKISQSGCFARTLSSASGIGQSLQAWLGSHQELFGSIQAI